jgi:hypothetical protein
VRLGTRIPFAQAVDASRFFIGLQVSEPTVCRPTGASEGAYMAVQAAPVEAIAQTLPETQAGPAVHLLGVDGAMLPLEVTAAFARGSPRWDRLKAAGGQSQAAWGSAGRPAVVATVAAPTPQTAASSIAGSSLALASNRPGSGATLKPALTRKLQRRTPEIFLLDKKGERNDVS